MLRVTGNGNTISALQGGHKRKLPRKACETWLLSSDVRLARFADVQ